MPDPDGHPGQPDRDDILRQRARVLEQLAGSAWHELANPLGGLRSFATMLRLEGWTSEQLGVDLALIEEAAARTQEIARALTELARGSARPAGLREVVTGTLAMAGHLLAEVSVEVDVPAALPEPGADAAAVRLVVASLAADSIAALGGPRSAHGRMRWSGRATGDGLEIVLEDDAPPGAPPDLGTLRAIAGAGGLTLAHEPLPARGNRYRLGMTADVGESGAAAAGPARSGPARTERPRSHAVPAPTVLVVDDDPAIRSLLVRMLAREGLPAREAASAGEALAAIGSRAVDVVLADHRMPGRSGVELHAAIAALRPDLAARYLLMSGDPVAETVASWAAATGIRVLAKPFDADELVAAVREAAAR